MLYGSADTIAVGSTVVLCKCSAAICCWWHTVSALCLLFGSTSATHSSHHTSIKWAIMHPCSFITLCCVIAQPSSSSVNWQLPTAAGDTRWSSSATSQQQHALKFWATRCQPCCATRASPSVTSAPCWRGSSAPGCGSSQRSSRCESMHCGTAVAPFRSQCATYACRKAAALLQEAGQTRRCASSSAGRC